MLVQTVTTKQNFYLFHGQKLLARKDSDEIPIQEPNPALTVEQMERK